MAEVTRRPPAVVTHWYSLQQVARVLGVPIGAVERLILEGPLRATQLGGKLLVRSLDLARYQLDEGRHAAAVRAPLRGGAL